MYIFHIGETIVCELYITPINRFFLCDRSKENAGTADKKSSKIDHRLKKKKAKTNKKPPKISKKIDRNSENNSSIPIVAFLR